ncbi:putative protein.03 [Ceratocystis platani]|uniref:Micro-fibrillar-associated protein 1 C-terminal domain-containing protein n=1 Tax=Ceratocystis fimbriata f. sp. platani TaxID=88771 RepID=A0A0F8DET2_CERFI|nr:putative protein.03 [Ceratocystis platani]
MPPSRMTKNPVRPARHRAGKATGADSSTSDSDSDEHDNELPTEPASKPPPKAASAARIATNLGKTSIEDRRRAEETEKQERRQAAQELEKLAAAEGFVTDDEEDSKREGDGGSDEGDSDDDDDDESSEEESSSEDEGPRRLMLRPKFIPKSQRLAKAAKNASQSTEETAQQVEEEARKKAEANALIEAQIQKDLAAKAVGKKHWDDEEDPELEVDDTDDVDPEAELAAFKLRKLQRYKRDREAMIAREKELEEIERRRNLTEDERRAEDEAHLAKQQEEVDAKGQMSYMQKYHHKGAFYQDQAETAGLANRDLMGARFADEIEDRSILPEYLQRRDMTKLGRKGASKYKDMRSENTGRWGELTERRPGEGNKDTNWRNRGDFGGNVDDRFKPDGDFRGGQGANADSVKVTITVTLQFPSIPTKAQHIA